MRVRKPVFQQNVTSECLINISFTKCGEESMFRCFRGTSRRFAPLNALKYDIGQKMYIERLGELGRFSVCGPSVQRASIVGAPRKIRVAGPPSRSGSLKSLN